MRVLITGITGFAGSHLAEYLLEQPGVEVFGIRRWRSPLDNIAPILDRITLRDCDLRDPASVQAMMAAIQPDRIFHLAAQSFVPSSWDAPTETFQTNVIGQLNLLEAARSSRVVPQIQIAGSSEEYGLVHEDELPILESNPLRPLSPYAVSKVSQDLLAYQYWKSYEIPVVRTRAFNHTGPRRGPVFATSNFARQIAEIEAGIREPVIRVGNLEARRDFTDVRDVVRAYWLALERGASGEVYNVCSGTTHAIGDVLTTLLSMSEVAIPVEEDPARLRPSDVPVLLGDRTRFTLATEWEPEIAFETTLADLLSYWRERTGAVALAHAA
jgi:GDP-4-dehydro-6-deoxy-D-mannose reductase